MGNLAFTDPSNQLTISNIYKMSICRLFEKIHSDVTAVFRTTPKQSKEASLKERLERVIKDQQVILSFPIGRRTAHLDPFLAALGDYWSGPLAILVEDLDDLQGLDSKVLLPRRLIEKEARQVSIP